MFIFKFKKPARLKARFCVFQGLICALALLFVTGSASAQNLHALVVGTDHYERARDLSNPANDARAVAQRLSQLGYHLHAGGPLLDPTRQDLLAAFRSFALALPEGATAVVFLAGHGLSQAGQTFLVPSDDGALTSRDDLVDIGVALRALTGRLAARTGVNAVLFIDACSANGLRAAGASDASGAGGAGDLVAIPDGSINLIYAATPGQIAADGEGPNSPFTAALLAALEAPNQQVSGLFRAMSSHMVAHNDGTQTPWLMQALGNGMPVHLVP
ncbi:MAG: caspase domain-containing protein [Devosiaceae bacterium]